MSSEALYERYKDALKRGHVASLRGHLDDALLAYAEAASIAPERPTPHASAGTALLRREAPGRGAAPLRRRPRGSPRATRPPCGPCAGPGGPRPAGEAADAFDALAEARVADGRLSDAVDAARLGLELAEGRDRRRTLERLIDRLRAADPDEPGRARPRAGAADARRAGRAPGRGCVAGNPGRPDRAGWDARDGRLGERARGPARWRSPGGMARRCPGACGPGACGPAAPPPRPGPARRRHDRGAGRPRRCRRGDRHPRTGARAAPRPGRGVPTRRAHRCRHRRVLPRAVVRPGQRRACTSPSWSSTTTVAGTASRARSSISWSASPVSTVTTRRWGASKRPAPAAAEGQDRPEAGATLAGRCSRSSSRSSDRSR